MSFELYFNDELRKCLNAVGLSDCGENDQWNYWYQRLHRAHDATVDRVTEVQRAENAKLRKMVHALLQCHIEDEDTCSKCDFRSPLHGGCMADVMADELGVVVEE